MSFPNKWNQFVAPTATTTSKGAAIAGAPRRNYWKYAKRSRGNNNMVKNPLNEQHWPRKTIGPLWNGCISAGNNPSGAAADHETTNSSTRPLRRIANPVKVVLPNNDGHNTGKTTIVNKSKYLARLNNDLRELWQMDETPPLCDNYAPSTSIPSFSVNLSGSLFDNNRNKLAPALAPETNDLKVDSIVRCESAEVEQRCSPFSSSDSDGAPPLLFPEHPGSPSLNYLDSSFRHASPTFVISSIANSTNRNPRQQEASRSGTGLLSVVRNESCNIPPQLTFYERICSAVNSACESSIDKLYPQNRTTIKTILQQIRQVVSEPVAAAATVDTGLNESDWPFSQMTHHHGTIGVVGGDIRSPSFGQSFGMSSSLSSSPSAPHNRNAGAYTTSAVEHDSDQNDDDGEISVRLF